MIAITGATGHLGREILTHLHTLASPETQIIACTRHLSKASALLKQGHEVRRADFAEPASLDNAFQGVSTLLIISVEGHDDERIRLHTQAIDAARRAGVPRMAYTSFFDVAADSPATVAKVHRLTEEAIMNSGCAWTLLRNGPYIDNVARRVAEAADNGGLFRMAANDACLPFISRSDLAEAAAHALLSDREGNRAYQLSGAELLSFHDLAHLVSQTMGKPVSYQNISPEAYLEELRREGLPPELQTRRAGYAQAMREGFMTALTDDFRQLVGRAPQPMRDVIAQIDLTRGNAH